MARAPTLAAALLVLLTTGGCPSDPPPGVDAGGDGGGDHPDGGDTSALRFEFVSQPAIPGEVSGEHTATIASAELDLANVRAIGDAAPGDERTTAAAYAIAFADHAPANFLLFADAPPGIYSHLLAQVVGYRIAGTVVLDQEPVPFAIDDTPPAPLSVAIALSDVVVDNQRTDVSIEVDVGHVVAEVEWELFDPGASNVDIDEDWSAIGEVREKVVEAFQDETESESSGDAGE